MKREGHTTSLRGRDKKLLIGTIALFFVGVFSAGADTSAPLHNWTIRVGDSAYGLKSWAPGHWDMYLGSGVEPGASVIVQYIAVILPMFLLGILASWSAVILLRLASGKSPGGVSAGLPLQLGRPRLSFHIGPWARRG